MTGLGEHWLKIVHILSRFCGVNLTPEGWPNSNEPIVTCDQPFQVSHFIRSSETNVTSAYFVEGESCSTKNNWLEIANINIDSSIFSEDASPVMSEDVSVEKMGEFSRTKGAPYPYKALIYLIN